MTAYNHSARPGRSTSKPLARRPGTNNGEPSHFLRSHDPMIARTRWLVAAAAVTVVALSSAAAAPVPAGTEAAGLAAVPAQAPIVIHLRGVERTKDRLTKMLNAAIPDLGPVAAAQLDQLLQ